jgi:hypothetical protein
MSRNSASIDLLTTVDDELFEELADLAGQRVAHIAIWEESLVDELVATTDEDDNPDADDDFGIDNGLDLDEDDGGMDDDEPPQEVFDLDLYLADGIYFELYGTLCYPDLDAEPLRGSEQANKHLLSLVNQEVWFDEVAVDEEDQLVLVLSQFRQPVMYLVVGGWLIEEWDELPTG